jgi:hypothetical protein
MFEVRELPGKGKGLVATEFIKAGAIVHRENPLMHLVPSFVLKYRGYTPKGTEQMMAAMSFFRKQMRPEQQAKYLALYGDITGPRADNLRDFVQSAEFDGLPATQSLKDLFVRVVLILNYNSFGTSQEIKIYEQASRFCHSCESNCTYNIDGPEIIIRSRRSIEPEEELTLDYYGSRKWLPIHKRRYKWMDVKDFTCHCQRCDALGDDTRQFHCHDSNCKGLHRVCQPLNKEPLPSYTTTYTGVEYVEPHLLPCTVCQRSPPPAYQSTMFKQETSWVEALEDLPVIPSKPAFLELSELKGPGGQPVTHTMPEWTPHIDDVPGVLVRLKVLQYQVSHAAGFQMALCELRCYMELLRAGQTGYSVPLLMLVTEMDSFLDHYFSAPREHHSTILMDMYAAYNRLGDTANAARLFKRLIRSERILRGRDQQSPVETLFDVAVGYTGGPPDAHAFSSAAKPGCCVYCEESAEYAAMTLSRCSACKKVTYCGAACQKAHWKWHKAECKK